MPKRNESKKKAPKSQNLESFRACAKLAALKQRAHLSEMIQDSKRDKGKLLRLERKLIGFTETKGSGPFNFISKFRVLAKFILHLPAATEFDVMLNKKITYSQEK